MKFQADIVRSKPLFYYAINGNCFIIKNLEQYQKEIGYFEVDVKNLEQYISSGFVYGNGTIYKNVYALQAGEIVIIDGNKITSERYFEYKPSDKPLVFKSIADFSATLDQVFISVFSRMVADNKNVNRWIIPLSGGHDSRIIVNYLYRLGVKNVLCFSYGTPENEQSRISRKVAEALTYPWYFVEYTEEKWLQLHQNGLIEDYIRFAFNGISTPHLQDFLAVYELKEKGILKDGDVFIPGHALDFLAGSHLSVEDVSISTPEAALERVAKKFAHSAIGKRIISRINDIQIESKINPKHFQEYFNWQERQAKFIVNSIRAYEFYGYEAYLPFWDKELVDFWLKVPDEDRIGRNIFFEAERNGLLIEALKNIPFAGENQKLKRHGIEQIIKKILPQTLISSLLRATGRKVKLNEGLNQIYALKAKTVKELLEPIEDFPIEIRPYLKGYLKRYPFQMDYHFLTVLYTLRILFNDSKKNDQN